MIARPERERPFDRYIYTYWFEGKGREESTGKGPGVKTAFEARSVSSGVGDRRTAGATPAPICGRPCARDSLSLFSTAGQVMATG